MISAQTLAVYLSCIHFSVEFKICQHYAPRSVSVKSLVEMNLILWAWHHCCTGLTISEL